MENGYYIVKVHKNLREMIGYLTIQEINVGIGKRLNVGITTFVSGSKTTY